MAILAFDGRKEGVPADRTARWREVIGPLFREIWPLDAPFRDERTSHNLVLMVLECEGAFEDAVETVIDFIVPHRMYQLSHSLLSEQEHGELLRQYPRQFLRLASALIDPAAYPVPNDLAESLQACVDADATVVNEPSYVRLYGLRRQRGA